MHWAALEHHTNTIETSPEALYIIALRVVGRLIGAACLNTLSNVKSGLGRASAYAFQICRQLRGLAKCEDGYTSEEGVFKPYRSASITNGCSWHRVTHPYASSHTFPAPK